MLSAFSFVSSSPLKDKKNASVIERKRTRLLSSMMLLDFTVSWITLTCFLFATIIFALWDYCKALLEILWEYWAEKHNGKPLDRVNPRLKVINAVSSWRFCHIGKSLSKIYLKNVQATTLTAFTIFYEHLHRTQLHANIPNKCFLLLQA